MSWPLFLFRLKVQNKLSALNSKEKALLGLVAFLALTFLALLLVVLSLRSSSGRNPPLSIAQKRERIKNVIAHLLHTAFSII
jgi:hypothetical protein